jgi:hypothetical protein
VNTRSNNHIDAKRTKKGRYIELSTLGKQKIKDPHQSVVSMRLCVSSAITDKDSVVVYNCAKSCVTTARL